MFWRGLLDNLSRSWHSGNMISRNPATSEVAPEKIWATYEQTQSIRRTAKALGLSRMKVHRALRKDPARLAAVMGYRRQQGADDFEYLADEFVKEIVHRMESPEERAKISFKDLVICLAICIDKALLLKKQPTQIHGAVGVDHDEILAEILQDLEAAGGQLVLPPQTMARLQNRGFLPKPDSPSPN